MDVAIMCGSWRMNSLDNIVVVIDVQQKFRSCLATMSCSHCNKANAVCEPATSSRCARCMHKKIKCDSKLVAKFAGRPGNADGDNRRAGIDLCARGFDQEAGKTQENCDDGTNRKSDARGRGLYAGQKCAGCANGGW